MARSRTLRPGFFSNEDLASLEPLARILFEALWCLSDREGRLEDRPRRIKTEALPYDDCDVDALLQNLHDAGFICRYETEGARYIEVPNFRRHQRPHPKEAKSVIPAPGQGCRGKVVPSREKDLASTHLGCIEPDLERQDLLDPGSSGSSKREKGKGKGNGDGETNLQPSPPALTAPPPGIPDTTERTRSGEVQENNGRTPPDPEKEGLPSLPSEFGGCPLEKDLLSPGGRAQGSDPEALASSSEEGQDAQGGEAPCPLTGDSAALLRGWARRLGAEPADQACTQLAEGLARFCRGVQAQGSCARDGLGPGCWPGLEGEVVRVAALEAFTAEDRVELLTHQLPLIARKLAGSISPGAEPVAARGARA